MPGGRQCHCQGSQQGQWLLGQHRQISLTSPGCFWLFWFSALSHKSIKLDFNLKPIFCGYHRRWWLRGISWGDSGENPLRKRAVARTLHALVSQSMAEKQLPNHSCCCCVKYNSASFSATPFQCEDREPGDLFATALLRSSSQLLSSCRNTFFLLLVWYAINSSWYYLLMLYFNLLLRPVG